MQLWKQSAISVAVVVAAIVIWARFFPGAPEILQRWGMDWAVASTPSNASSSPQSGGHGFNPQQGLVVVANIESATINDKLSAIGTGRAANSVTVTPFTSGTLKEVVVAAGQSVQAGEPIAYLDAEAEEIAVDRARISLADAEARVERISALRSSNTATAVQHNEANLAASNARLALRDAELALRRRTIDAPISGIIGILPVSVGNTVTQQTQITTIDNRSSIIVDFWVPERFAPMLSIGQGISAASVARPDESYNGTISAIDNRIDTGSRTLQVQARIENNDDKLRAGMSFQVSMGFPGDVYPSVNPLAIQWGTEGAYVWSVDVQGKAQRVNVRIIQRNTDSVLVAGDFGAAKNVVIEGIHSVRNGETVQIVNELPEEMPQAALPSSGT